MYTCLKLDEMDPLIAEGERIQRQLCNQSETEVLFLDSKCSRNSDFDWRMCRREFFANTFRGATTSVKMYLHDNNYCGLVFDIAINDHPFNI